MSKLMGGSKVRSDRELLIATLPALRAYRRKWATELANEIELKIMAVPARGDGIQGPTIYTKSDTRARSFWDKLWNG